MDLGGLVLGQRGAVRELRKLSAMSSWWRLRAEALAGEAFWGAARRTGRARPSSARCLLMESVTLHRSGHAE